MVRYFLYHSYRGFKRPGSHLHHLSNERCLCLLTSIPPIWILDQDGKLLTMSNDYSTGGVRVFAICSTVFQIVAGATETSRIMLETNFYTFLCTSCTLFPL